MRKSTKLQLLIFLLFCVFNTTAHAQRNSVTVSGVGNFNPTTWLTLTAMNDTPMISFNKSSFGGAAEYSRWFTPTVAVGAMYEVNPSDIKFFLATGKFSIDPHLLHQEVIVLATERQSAGPIMIFEQVGPGVVLTYGNEPYDHPGWTADFALVYGGGVERVVNRRVSLVGGLRFLNSKPGCYDDHTCKASWGVTEDGHAGVQIRW